MTAFALRAQCGRDARGPSEEVEPQLAASRQQQLCWIIRSTNEHANSTNARAQSSARSSPTIRPPARRLAARRYASPEEVQQAVHRARAAQPAWASLSFRERARVILQARELMLAERDETRTARLQRNRQAGRRSALDGDSADARCDALLCPRIRKSACARRRSTSASMA